MHIRDFWWDEWNSSHIARHTVEPYEAEEICLNAKRILKRRRGSYAAYGQATSGRYLLVIYAYKGAGRVRVMTAREMNDQEKHWVKSI